MAQSASALTARSGSRTDEIDRMRHRVDDLRTAIARDVYEVRIRVRETFDLRRQVARHPLVTAAVVLGGLFVATRIVRSLLRRAQAHEAKPSRRGHGEEPLAVAQAPGSRCRKTRNQPKEGRE